MCMMFDYIHLRILTKPLRLISFGFQIQIKHACALVLVYDFLFGPGLQCGGALKEAVMRNKSCLLSALARLKVKAKVSKNEDLLPKKVTESGTVCNGHIHCSHTILF